jgi:hypothetical protein
MMEAEPASEKLCAFFKLIDKGKCPRTCISLILNNSWNRSDSNITCMELIRNPFIFMDHDLELREYSLQAK